MPAYNFQRQFGPALRAGTKTTTIRARRKDGRVPRVGQPFSAWHGLRSKQTELIFRGEITKVQEIEIYNQRGARFVRVDQRLVSLAERDLLAQRDGFENCDALFAWFLELHGKAFHGHLITWRRES